MKRWICAGLCLLLLFCGACSAGQKDAAETNELYRAEAEPQAQQTSDAYRNYYEIFVYSFYDSDGDGVGDLNGVTQKLDYIASMGFNGIWLMPICPSPTYHKYDACDYCAVDPLYGDLDDFSALTKAAHERGITVITDLVLNHTSSEHPWFTAACEALRSGDLSNPYIEYYNFTTETGKSGYERLSGTDYWYECRFWSGMPDLNLDSAAVRKEIRSITDFWLGLGADGFRLDAVTSYYTGNVEKNVEFLSYVNDCCKAADPDCYLVGEAWEASYSRIRSYYASGVDSFFLFPLAQDTGDLANILKDNRTDGGAKYGALLLSLQETFDTGVMAPFLCNHDTARSASFLRSSREDKIKMAAGLLFLLSGATFTYYGEEIGMTGSGQDPNKRIAFLWEDDRSAAGYTFVPPDGAAVTDKSYVYPSAASQQADASSILNYYKTALLLRNAYPAVARGTANVVEQSASERLCLIEKTWNGERVLLAVNTDPAETLTLSMDFDALGYSTVGGQLLSDVTVRGGLSLDGQTLTLPPYSILVLIP